MRGPTVIPRAEIDRDTAQRQAFAPPRNQIAELPSMAGELVGTEPLARGVMALRGDYTGRPEPGRAAGEFGMAAVNLGLGALGLADDVAAVRAARPLRAMPESAPRPTPPPRQIGRASDGSVLPVREPQPFRQAEVGGSDDLRQAAGMRLARDPLPPLRTMGQREDWAQGALRPQRGYEFRGPRDSRYGVRFERTANGTEVTLESLTPSTSQYGRRDENIMSMGEARSVYQRALAAIEHDIATTARDRYVVGGLKPQHRRIFRAMAERQMRANGWPGYVLEDGPSNTLVLRRADDAGPAGSNNRPDPHGPGQSVGANAGGGGRRARQVIDVPAAATARLGYGRPFEMIVNPSEADIARLIRRAEVADPGFQQRVRYITDADGNVYVGDAIAADHDMIEMAAGVRRAQTGMIDRQGDGFVFTPRDAESQSAPVRALLRPGNRPPPPSSESVGADMRRPLFPGRRK